MLQTEHHEILEELKREVVNQYHEFSEYKYLFYGSEKRTRLLNSVARHFFGELFYVLLERIILGVSKLTDPPGSGSRQNLSLKYVHECLSNETRYPREEADRLIKQAQEVGAHVATWRSKLVAHKDAMTALGRQNAGEVMPNELEKFYALVQEYLECVNQALEIGPFPIDTTAYYGASDLVQALKRAVAFNELLEKDVLKYDAALHGSEYADT